jgi:hypothetical protein
MREHIGVDVDAISEAEHMGSDSSKPDYGQTKWDPDTEQEYGQEAGVTRVKKSQRKAPVNAVFHDAVDGLKQGSFVDAYTRRSLFDSSRKLSMEPRKQGLVAQPRHFTKQALNQRGSTQRLETRH